MVEKTDDPSAGAVKLCWNKTTVCDAHCIAYNTNKKYKGKCITLNSLGLRQK